MNVPEIFMETIISRDGHKYVRLAEIPMNNGQFKFNGREYELDADFEPLGYPEFYDDEDGKLRFLSYVERGEWKSPLLLEVGEFMDEVSIYREVTA